MDNLRSEDRVYLDTPGLGWVNYSVGQVFPLCGVLVLFSGIVLALGLKSGELGVAPTALGALAFLIMIPLLTY